MRLLLAVGGLLLTSAAVSSVDAQSADTSFALPRNAVIDITMRSGRLIVRGSDRTSAELRGNDQRYDVRASGVGVVVAPRDDRKRSGGRDDALELSVPHGVRVVISAGTADVEIEDIAGDVEVHSLSGDIALQAIGGRVILETLSGDIRLTQGADGARVTSMSGDITLRGIRGNADIHTTSGDVVLGMVRGAQVQVESISGDIDLDGDITDNARLQLTSHSGDVTVRLAENTHGVMEMSTFSGELTANRPLTMMSGTTSSGGRRERDARRFEFGGGGTARLVITTFNGDVRFDRGSMRAPEQEILLPNTLHPSH